MNPKVLAISDLQINETLFDYCIIATKSYDTEWSAKMMDRHVKADGAFISVQNGSETEHPTPPLDHSLLHYYVFPAISLQTGLIQA